jgi:hypothetical protein
MFDKEEKKQVSKQKSGNNSLNIQTENVLFVTSTDKDRLISKKNEIDINKIPTDSDNDLKNKIITAIIDLSEKPSGIVKHQHIYKELLKEQGISFTVYKFETLLNELQESEHIELEEGVIIKTIRQKK